MFGYRVIEGPLKGKHVYIVSTLKSGKVKVKVGWKGRKLHLMTPDNLSRVMACGGR